jgi:hypothetical protein
MSENQMKFKELPLSEIPPVGSLFFIGRTGSGKTSAILNLCNKLKADFSLVKVLCGSESTCELYRQHIPSAHVHYIDNWDKPTAQMFKSWVDRLEKINGKHNDPLKKARAIIIMDDLAYLGKIIAKDPTFGRLMMNGRHPGVLFMLSLQYGKIVGPIYRSQVHRVFCSVENNPGNRKKIFDEFNPCFREFEDFDRAMVACTQNFEVCVLKTVQSKSAAVGDNVWFLRTEWLLPPFKMMPYDGSWDLQTISQHERLLDSENRGKGPDFTIFKQYRKPRSKVKKRNRKSLSRRTVHKRR